MNAVMARRRSAARAGRRYHPLLYVVVASLGAAILVTLAAPRRALAVPPPAPQALTQWGPQGRLAAGGALNRLALAVSFRAGAGTSAATPEVEVAAAGRPFSGRVTARGQPIPAGTRPTIVRVVIPHLRDGIAYHWRARLRAQDGRTSRWVAFGAGRSGSAVAFLVDRTAPPAPRLSSPTDPDPNTWYATAQVSMTWPAPPDAGGIAGYAYALDRSPRAVPAPRLMARRPGVDILIPADGLWYMHVRAVDRAGNWGPVASYALHIDRHPAAFATVSFLSTAFDPDVERENVAVTLSGPAHLRAQVLNEFNGSLVRALDLGRVRGRTMVRWDGRDDQGRPVSDGPYRFLLTATDAYGRQAVADYSGITVLRRRLVVSLSKQSMVAYDGTRAVLSTLVTTGNKELPTPLGTFHILNKLHPFTFISPWPPGSKYYYAPSPVQYALLFDWNGFYIHDAPWRSVFGPGSNARPGTPGQNFTGTHGCVNVAPSVAAWLYDWAPIGTVVQVVP